MRDDMIRKIMEYLFHSGAESYGYADCHGDDRGSCFCSEGGICTEFRSCRSATQAMDQGDRGLLCPRYVSREEAWEKAEEFYEGAAGMYHLESVRDHRRGIDAWVVVAGDGVLMEPDQGLLHTTKNGDEEELVWFRNERREGSMLVHMRWDPQRPGYGEVKVEWVEAVGTCSENDLSPDQRRKLNDLRRQYEDAHGGGLAS